MNPDQLKVIAPQFDLQNADAYGRWRTQKLRAAAPPVMVDIADPYHLSPAEHGALIAQARQHNLAGFRFRTPPTDSQGALIAFGRALGLQRLDANLCAGEQAISALTDLGDQPGRHYIPYTNRPLSWHTDGYYNTDDAQVCAWLLYCAQPAAEGGDNEVLDHDIAYIRLRDQDPALIAALSAAETFAIPPNEADGETLRPEQSGPVFGPAPGGQALHMRYTARRRNIRWADDAATTAARQALDALFSAGDEHMYRKRLEAGEGLLSNNVLHMRHGFTDDPDPARRRLMYRARYFDRIAGT